jgi:hypothetical protein
MIDFSKLDSTKEEYRLYSKVVKRAHENRLDIPKGHRTFMDEVMDLEVCHKMACALDLEAMLTCRPEDLFHDLYGIARNLNREKGELDNCFLPRMAKKEAA